MYFRSILIGVYFSRGILIGIYFRSILIGAHFSLEHFNLRTFQTVSAFV